jgi:hypothetical protein
VDEPARSSSLLHAWRRLALAHLWLAVSMVAWRVIEGMPSTAAVTGGTFAASLPGRALAVVTVAGGIVALLVLIRQTFWLRRDVRALALLAALIGALWSRARFDAFDVTWLALVTLAVALVMTAPPSVQRVNT